jgi:hypothetical protein
VHPSNPERVCVGWDALQDGALHRRRIVMRVCDAVMVMEIGRQIR